MTENTGDLTRWFADRRQEFSERYLLPDNTEHQQSGWMGRPDDWRDARIVILDGVSRSGDFLDIGCANGLLVQSLMEWGAERGLEITPHGIDLVPELIDLARERLPEYRDNFEVANAFDWQPSRTYDFVHTLLEYVPEDRQPAYLQRLLDEVVAPGGRLIVSSYARSDDSKGPLDIDLHLQMLGFRTAGCGIGMPAGSKVVTRSAWVDR